MADGVGEEKGLLGNEADVVAESLEGQVVDGVAVDEDGAWFGVEDAGDEVDEGRFAGAGGAYDREAGAGGDVEGDVAEDCGGVGVGESEVVEADVALNVGGGGGDECRVVDDGRLLLEEFVDADDGGGAPLE